MEISVEMSQKLKAELPWPSDITLWHISRKEVKLWNLQRNRWNKKIWHWMRQPTPRKTIATWFPYLWLLGSQHVTWRDLPSDHESKKGRRGPGERVLQRETAGQGQCEGGMRKWAWWRKATQRGQEEGYLTIRMLEKAIGKHILSCLHKNTHMKYPYLQFKWSYVIWGENDPSKSHL